MRKEYTTLINKKKASLTHKINKKNQLENTQASLNDNEIFTYENLPFQKEMISDFFPVLKHLNYSNKDA